MLPLGFPFCFEADDALAKVSDLHGVANGIQKLGMTTFGSSSFVVLHARLQRVKAALQFTNLTRQRVFKRLPNILHQGPTREYDH